jgi:hypothetical protein
MFVSFQNSDKNIIVDMGLHQNTDFFENETMIIISSREVGLLCPNSPSFDPYI